MLPKLWCCGQLWTPTGSSRPPNKWPLHILQYFSMFIRSIIFVPPLQNVNFILLAAKGVCLLSLYMKGSTQKVSLGSPGLESIPVISTYFFYKLLHYHNSIACLMFSYCINLQKNVDTPVPTYFL